MTAKPSPIYHGLVLLSAGREPTLISGIDHDYILAVARLRTHTIAAGKSIAHRELLISFYTNSFDGCASSGTKPPHQADAEEAATHNADAVATVTTAEAGSGLRLSASSVTDGSVPYSMILCATWSAGKSSCHCRFVEAVELSCMNRASPRESNATHRSKIWTAIMLKSCWQYPD